MELAAGFLFLLCVALLAFIAWKDEQGRKERAELFQRLQAPESATLAYTREHEGQPGPVPTLALDDDEGYEALRLRREGSIPD